MRMQKMTGTRPRVDQGRRRRRAGLTLLECILALVIVPLAVAAVAMAVSTGQNQAVAALDQTRAAMLAEALMERVLAQDYADVQSFCNSFSESAGTVRDPTGQLYPQPMQSFRRTIACTPQTMTLHLAGGETFSRRGWLVTVNVLRKGTVVTSMSRFIVEPP